MSILRIAHYVSRLPNLSFPQSVNDSGGSPELGQLVIHRTTKSSLKQKLVPRYKNLRGAPVRRLCGGGMAVILASCLLLLTSYFLFSVSSANAGGPISVGPDGDASKWVSPISLHPESGSCATFSNAAMLTKLATNIAYWEDITGISLEFSIVTGSVGSVNSTNYTTYYVDSSGDAGLDDSINPVIFDDDGEIVDGIFGDDSKYSVLGFAGPDGYTNSSLATIGDGQAFFNCFCLSGNTNDTGDDCADLGVTFTEDDLDFTMTHEIGHLIGLDHTQVNQSLDSSGACDTSVVDDCTALPTMYPRSVDAEDQLSPQRDDQVAALNLYGLTYVTNNFCTVTGSLTDSSGNPLRCADVQATTGDEDDTIAQVSGAMAPATDSNGDGDTADSGECDSDCGDFTLRGLDPSKTYTITVQPINSAWGVSFGSSINPCGTDLVSGITEEEIATVTGCTAGSNTNLGTVRTTSTGGVGGDDDDDDSSSSSAGCSLASTSASNWTAFLVLFAGWLFLLFFRRHSRKA